MKKVLIAILTIGALGAWFGYRHWRAPKPAESGQEQRILYYHCPMHPDYHSDRQGDCPICGMRLTPVHAEERSSAAPSGQIHISPEKQHLIGVQVGEASMASVSRTIRAVGRVALDETRVVKIHPRVDGWVEAVYGDFLGQFIQKGQPLVKIYSPELAATQQEYLLALRSQEIMQHSSMPGVAARSGSLVEAARRRLGLWDLSEPQIEELHRTRKPSAAI
ncbi:MAG TPA: efflux RND transporter periplasmic adaptor subunit, partial [Bryobacteraceae bacterium]|nr:efflux RND transporter periplasmic adaptor subunit [Bryobacteraceae bacterium]